jgi:rRNA biogenesis protein RRP5
MKVYRNIFDRVLVHKMTSHKAKSVVCLFFRAISLLIYLILFRSFFKKWFELEKRIGDVQGTEAVKAKAIEWTQRASNAS